MLAKLSEVQTKDLALDTLEAEKNETPQDLIELKAQHEGLSQQLAVKEQQFHEIRQEVNANELELESLATRKKSASESALQAGSAKEASQFQNQELQFTTRLQELEEDTLPLLERMEAIEAERDDLKTQVDEISPKLEEQTAQEEARVQEVESRMDSLKKERDSLAGEVTPSLLKQYESVRRSKRGTGLAEVKNGDRCGGCNVKLPIFVLQKIKKGGTITRCPSCGRILWLKNS